MNAMFHAHKHIDVQYHFIKAILEDGLISLIKVNTSQNPANDLTNRLTKAPKHYIDDGSYVALSSLLGPSIERVLGNKGPKDSPHIHFNLS